MSPPVPPDTSSAHPVRYRVRFPAPQTHYLEVEATYPPTGREPLDLFMAVWTPGSYLIREYQRHVEQVAAQAADGRPLVVEKTAKNRWRVTGGHGGTVTLTYRVYGREMSVRTNWIESSFALINGAPTFMAMVGDLARPHEVAFELPDSWSAAATALVPLPAERQAFRADDFDTLIDSPVLLGNPVQREFVAGGRRHVMAFEGDTSFFDVDRVTADTRRIVEAGARIMGDRYDYPFYYGLTLVVDAGGGLEHANSFLVMAHRFAMRTRRSYLAYLSLVAHEFFHVWNIKRLRPIELGPFDYERETHTRALWMAEGFTDYYAGLLVRRAGLSTPGEYLDELSDQIEAVQTTPGRLVTAADQSSYDSWIKQYRPDENTPNTTVNYYPKGAVIAFLLDAHLRRLTGGGQSLDDAMRLAYVRYSGARGFTIAEFYQTVSEVAGTDLTPWFAQTVESTAELAYNEALEWFGLRFRPVDTRHPRAWLGATTKNDAGRLVVSEVRRETPAHAAGVNVDDEILAIDDVRVRADGLGTRLEQYQPGVTVSLLVARRDRLLSLDVTLDSEPGQAWRLEVHPGATEAQRNRLAAWLAA